ncbi:RrF2 family transcriptional regulator [Nocardia cyriacigeorgica]|uniref:RrF2 family transcriptional regulator n=1 Tax=Nocardia cyriacigeorgica TaxID=135487 RepID=UPI001892D473|nr:Rrf2 family transcriptional regulator [Nocardia cyriacigeorgica]MBF6435914.1 Rrf2 family transcriptional regulator [Nocardia cyriacigeorgica]MBF6454007.1 Rrf2 family transcriptional regulator [Nocardia cyriacigeorgica]MBF6481232.1 Rrf2 family transcriptional regulator [Nocardia cyriacigeorgica]MBF6551901.1 Rrf2 family transcriptional regulator [Nocardia cyriacigeorgica]
MQLTRFTDIGLRALMRLAVSDEADNRVTTRLIARQVNASERHVAKAVTQLVELGFVQAQRGRSGGLFITETGRGASVGALVRALEGDREVVLCEGDHPCPLAGSCRLRRILADAKEAFYRELDRYTVTDLVTGPAVELLHLLTIPSVGGGSEVKESQ